MHHHPCRLRFLAIVPIILGCVALVLGVLFLSLDHGGGVGAKTPQFFETTCDDFTSWELANDHFEGIDPASFEVRILDSNGNGIPCEGLMPRASLPHEEFDVVCDDFQHRDEAEYFFEVYDSLGENRFGLDRDLDGRPCETLPPLDSMSRVLNRLDRLWSDDARFVADANCGYFETWVEANEFFLQAGGPENDPHRLDNDSDGIPCESLPGAPTEP